MTALTKSRFPGDVTIGGRHIFTALEPVLFVLLPFPRVDVLGGAFRLGPKAQASGAGWVATH